MKCSYFVVEPKKVFKEKRKHYYKEYGNVKLARELIEKELAELEDDDDTAQVFESLVLKENKYQFTCKVRHLPNNQNI
mgnify:CR=1 FL=1